MIRTDSRCPDKFYGGTMEEGFVYFCDRSYNQGIRIFTDRSVYRSSTAQYHFTKIFKRFSSKRNIFIYD